MNKQAMRRGSCFCGMVEVEVRGEPEQAGFCHCTSCRHWSAGPVNAFTLWKPANFRVIRGGDDLGSFQKSETSIRHWCNRCGGHVYTEHPTFELVDVYAAVLPDLPFEPAVHVQYQSTVHPMRDGLPKMRDFPAELGGTGETMNE